MTGVVKPRLSLAFELAERVGSYPSYACTAVLSVAADGWFIIAWQRR